MNDIWLDKVVYEFSQDVNTDGTTKTEGYDDLEILTVEVQSSSASLTKEPGYFVLRTPTGWSINNSSELMEIMTIVKNGIGGK